jgi:hypothetical protein
MYIYNILGNPVYFHKYSYEITYKMYLLELINVIINGMNVYEYL